jgi:hypothetical protein
MQVVLYDERKRAPGERNNGSEYRGEGLVVESLLNEFHTLRDKLQRGEYLLESHKWLVGYTPLLYDRVNCLPCAKGKLDRKAIEGLSLGGKSLKWKASDPARWKAKRESYFMNRLSANRLV